VVGEAIPGRKARRFGLAYCQIIPGKIRNLSEADRPFRLR
jgi:hypothetical protein